MHHRPLSGASRAMNAAGVAAALAERAEQVCRRYLPHGRRQGRYWVAGDLDGARGRSLYVRLNGPGTPGKWTDASVGTHGDLLDIIRHRIDAPTLRAALDEARAFLALPPAPAAGGSETYDAVEAARRLWRYCRAIDGTHAEAYLRARGLARCRFPALRFHPRLLHRDGSAVRRLPALVAAVHRRRRRGARGSAHLARSPLAREGEARLAPQGAWARIRSRRALRPPRRDTARRRGNRDGPLRRHRGPGHRGRRRALRRQPRRLRASTRSPPPRHRPRQ